MVFLYKKTSNRTYNSNKFHFHGKLTLQRLGGWGGGGQIDLPRPCDFSKSVYSKDRVKPWFFVTFNTILRHIFPENFIEFPQVVQKI